jgi:hypothetical protein
VSVKTKGMTGERPKAARETSLTFPTVIAELHHQWIEMVRANTNNTLDFAHQVLRLESSVGGARAQTVRDTRGPGPASDRDGAKAYE